MEDFYTLGASQEKKNILKITDETLKIYKFPVPVWVKTNSQNKMDVNWISQNKSKPLPLFLAEFFVDED